jgi:hypothetical protein
LDISLNSTTPTNRKGWPKEQMDLVMEKCNRGQLKMAWDPINHVQVGQWVDTMVVSIVSTNRSTQIGTVKRRIGAIRENLPCPQILISNQKTMFGVDKGDQYWAACFEAHVLMKRVRTVEPDLLQGTFRDWNSWISNSMMHHEKPLVEMLANQGIGSDIPIVSVSSVSVSSRTYFGIEPQGFRVLDPHTRVQASV